MTNMALRITTIYDCDHRFTTTLASPPGFRVEPSTSRLSRWSTGRARVLEGACAQTELTIMAISRCRLSPALFLDRQSQAKRVGGRETWMDFK